MNKLKRAFAGFTTFICILSTSSCSLKGGLKGNESGDNSDKPEKIMDKAYSSVELDTDFSFDNIRKMSLVGDTGKIFIESAVFDESGHTHYEMYLTDTEFSEFNEVKYEIPEADNIESNVQTAVTSDGNILVVSCVIDYGDAELPDYDDPDFDYENFDYDAMIEAAKTTYNIAALDKDGNLISENEIKGIEKYKEDYNIPNIYSCNALGADKVLIDVNDHYLAVDMDGNITEMTEFNDDEYMETVGNDVNGNIVYTTNVEDKYLIKTIDASTLTKSPNEVDFNNTDFKGDFITYIVNGVGDYTVFLSGSKAIYGMKQDGTIEEVVNWSDSDINVNSVSNIMPLEDGDFLIYEENWDTDSKTINRLTKRDPSEFENIQIITIAMDYTDTTVGNAIQRFNKSNKDYRIRVDDYSKYDEWDEEKNVYSNTAEKQLKQDIASGKKFDMISMYGNTLILNLANKGALTDMYEYMGKDGTVSKDDIVDPVLKSGDVNGKLVSLSPSFSISTLACKTKFCDKENWTLDDMISTYEKHSDGMTLIQDKYSTKRNIFDEFTPYCMSFADYKNATCNFNDPEFIKFLEFCNGFGDDEFDWDNASDDETTEHYMEIEVANRNDKALLRSIDFYEIREYARAKQGYFGDDITLVGYPSADGNGAIITPVRCISIMGSSEKKDICWSFISSLFDEEYQGGNGSNLNGLPALKTSFEKILDEAMDKPYYMDNGKKVENDDFVYIGDEEIKINPLTQEERDYLEQYILGAESDMSFFDNELLSIIDEEVDAYFAGEKSAEETASIIQNRASILISEQS